MTDLELNTAIATLLDAPKTHYWEPTGQCGYIEGLYACKNCGEYLLADLVAQEEPGCIPPYATDLNRAVAAGRTLKLFDYDVSIDIHSTGNGATVYHRYTERTSDAHYDCMELIGQDRDHPARAVCNAIVAFTQLKAAKKIIGDGDHAWLQ